MQCKYNSLTSHQAPCELESNVVAYTSW